jgi:hypothetical protein
MEMEMNTQHKLNVMKMKTGAHCGGIELQIGTNTRTHGKLDGDNTNRNKKETLRP